MADTETFDVNQRYALLAIDDADRQGEVSAALQGLGYRIHVSQSMSDGRDRLRKHSYDVVVIDERCHGSTPLDNELLRLLEGMSMATRRYMLVALLGHDVQTLDSMSAFALSMNVVVNYNDVGQIRPILERALADNDLFFRVLRGVLHEAGKR